MSRNLGSSKIYDRSVITLGSNVGRSNVGRSNVGRSNVGRSNVALPLIHPAL